MSSDRQDQARPRADASKTPPLAPPEERVLWRGEASVLKRPKADKPGEILSVLSRARKNASLYGAAHPFILETFTILHGSLQSMLATRPAVMILIHEETFFVDDTILLEDSLKLQPLLKAFEERQIDAMQIEAGVEAWELSQLIEVLNFDLKELQRHGGAAAYLEEHKVTHIKVGAIGSTSMIVGADGLNMGGVRRTLGPGGVDIAAGLDQKLRRTDEPAQGSRGGGPSTPRQPRVAQIDPHDAYRAGLRVRDELAYQVSINQTLSLQKAHVIVNSFVEIIAEDNTALPGIALIKNHDEDTYHHSVNVCILSLLIGSRLKLSRELLSTLGLAALMHDIGKVRIPQEVLTKPGRLTPEELDTIRRHTVYGAHALRDIAGLSRLLMVVAFEHHANYNLSGYPRISAKRGLNLLTRIVQVADVYDAMTSARRTYRRSLLREEALKVIANGAGTLYDPVVVKTFLQVQADLSPKNSGRKSGAA